MHTLLLVTLLTVISFASVIFVLIVIKSLGEEAGRWLSEKEAGQAWHRHPPACVCVFGPFPASSPSCLFPCHSSYRPCLVWLSNHLADDKYDVA